MNIIHYIQYMELHRPMSTGNDIFTDKRDPGMTDPAMAAKEA